MLRGMTIRQFGEWRAYADLEPFDETRADLRAADIVRTLLNVFRKKGQPAVKLQDCVLRFSGAPSRPFNAEKARADVRRTMEILMAIHKRPAGKKSPERKKH